MAAVGGLGEFLRARRARVTPADVGLTAGTGLRRTPGLRREELAAVAGVSVDYYIRLEQGREVNPSPAVLDAIARALVLDEEERTHLHAFVRRRAEPGNDAAGALGSRSGPGVREARREAVRPGILQLLETLRPCPAYVLNRIGDVLAANPEALALLCGLADWPPHRRNTARYTFLHPAARGLFADWPRTAAATTANLHAVAADDPDAPGLADLVGELADASAEFAALWRRYDIRRRRGEPKTFHHPRAGTVTLAYELLHLDDDQRVSIYQVPPGSTDHDVLQRLALAAAGLPPDPARRQDGHVGTDGRSTRR